MATSLAVSLAKNQPYNQTTFNQQESGKVSWDDPNVPIWTKMGFGNDEASYNAIYNPVAPTPVNSNPTVTTGDPISSRPSPIATPPTFAEYIKDHPEGGDAYAYVSAILREYGLESLDKWAQDSIQNNLSADQIMQSMREQEPYKQRFKAIEQRKAAGLPPISENEVITYEKQATQLMRSAGLPSGFWDSPDDFVNLQTSDVSLAELDSRINQGYVAMMQSPQDVRDQWNALGYGTGDMVAYFLDPTRTEAVLTKQLASTQRAAEAQRTGFGQLSTMEAENLAAQGISADQSQRGFTSLVKSNELFGSLPGENGQDISRADQLSATFNSNVAAQKKIEQRAAERVAQFGGGGNFTQGQDGRTGVGSAR